MTTPSSREQLPFVQRVRVGARFYHYFCCAGVKRTRIKGEPGSLEYLTHYNELVARAKGFSAPPIDLQQPGGRRFLAGMLGPIVERYLMTELPSKSLGTQCNYRRLIEILRRVEINGKNGATISLMGFKINELDCTKVAHIVRHVKDKHGNARADAVGTLLSVLWDFAKQLPESKRAITSTQHAIPNAITKRRGDSRGRRTFKRSFAGPLHPICGLPMRSGSTQRSVAAMCAG
jgi:hypothetical protein